MKVYQLQMNATDDNSIVTTTPRSYVYRTREMARDELASQAACLNGQEGYILRTQTPDVVIFEVKSHPRAYKLTLSIETFEVI